MGNLTYSTFPNNRQYDPTNDTSAKRQETASCDEPVGMSGPEAFPCSNILQTKHTGAATRKILDHEGSAAQLKAKLTAKDAEIEDLAERIKDLENGSQRDKGQIEELRLEVQEKDDELYELTLRVEIAEQRVR